MDNEDLSTYGYERVRAHTAPVVIKRIDAHTRSAIEEHVRRGRDGIVHRLAELDREWDVDRAMMANFALLGGAAFVLGLRKDKRWLGVFGAQLAFLMLHATVGWCPPASLFRRLGFRTTREIENERHALIRALETNQ